MANKPTFAQWVAHWWQKFDAMEVRDAYRVEKCAKDPELFVEVCKDYIDRAPDGNCYCFSEDYKFFKKFTYAESDVSYGPVFGMVKTRKNEK